MRFKEVYTSGKVGTFNIPFPSEIFSSLSRELVVTYLDSDLMIVRDSFGCPDVLQRSAESPPIVEPSGEKPEKENIEYAGNGERETRESTDLKNVEEDNEVEEISKESEM